jgi:16S rRNA (guanine966-N2)-methyltransferase
MRITAGSARGRRLVAPPGTQVRPTSERVRQAVFNALGARGAIDDAFVVDLFAGTGALGLEALSRGAASVTFVESDRRAIEFLRTNIEHLGYGDRTRVVRSDVVAYLRGGGPTADLVLADPPYTFDSWTVVLEPLAASLDSERGLLVAETPKLPDLGAHWEIVRQQRYGGTVSTFARPANTPASPTEA